MVAHSAAVVAHPAAAAAAVTPKHAQNLNMHDKVISGGVAGKQSCRLAAGAILTDKNQLHMHDGVSE